MKPITSDFLIRLANRIYDPKKPDRYLRLCKGTLVNGPDPTNKRRRMHCGLGELYFAATGEQPERPGKRLDEVDVAEQVTIAAGFDPFSEEREKFEKLLREIPTENDCASGYKTRARRVAELLRKAAGFLK